MANESWSKQSFQLAYIAASAALGIAPDESVLARLAALTHDASQLVGAVKAMRDAQEHGRVHAAMAYLATYQLDGVVGLRDDDEPGITRPRVMSHTGGPK